MGECGRSFIPINFLFLLLRRFRGLFISSLNGLMFREDAITSLLMLIGIANLRKGGTLLRVNSIVRLFVTACLLGAVQAADFKTDVLPIFQGSCYKCHGNGRTRGDLSLEESKIGRHIGSSGPIRPRDEESKIIKLINGVDGDRMPLKGRPLNEKEIAIITEWVKEGASLGKGTPYAVKNQEALMSGVWTNTEGKEIEADLLGVEGGKALLRIKGKVHRVPLEKLSEESRKKIEEAVK